LLPLWRGVEGCSDKTAPNDQSDYDRACSVQDYNGVLSCGNGDAFVLGGDVGDVAWFSNSDGEGGLFAQWIFADSRESMERAVASAETARLLDKAETVGTIFRTGPSGMLRLFDAAEPGDDINCESEQIVLRPGTYDIRAVYVEIADFAVILRGLLRLGP
jgi:hypothetical protein